MSRPVILANSGLTRQIVGVLFMVACTAAGSLPAAAVTLEVGPGRPHLTILSALSSASPGDRIEVAPGSYHENLTIVVGVELVGIGDPEIVGSGHGDVVRIVADDVALRGFTIRGSGRDMMTSDAGVRILGSRALVADNALSDNLFGIYLEGCHEVRIEHNEITGRKEVDIGRRGAGVHLYSADHNLVQHNRVSFVRDGVYFDHSDFNRVEDNRFHHLRYGVHYMYCKDNTFHRNIFRDSVAGVAIMYTERVVFSDNQILDNREGYHAFGLLLKDALDSVAERNVIANNASGIFLESSHHNRFRHNLVAFNDVGVVLYASALDNAFSDNDFVGNLAVLHTVGRAQAAWGPQGHGNFYTSYEGYDLDGNGRGDVPHRLQDAFEVLVGNHPLLQLFLTSAAADALAAAERSFPLVPSSDQVDETPAMRPVSGLRASTAGGAPGAGTPIALGWLAVVTLVGWAVVRGRR